MGSLTSQSSNTSLGSPLRSFHSDISSIETYSLASLITMIEHYQNAHMVFIEFENLSCACSLLPKQSILIEQLLALHPQFDRRPYFLLEQSCRAYFTYLQLSYTNTYGNVNEEKSNNNNNDAPNILVTLCLLNVLVRYPQQLRSIVEIILVNMTTVAWKHLIPELFSRLNHRDSFVRDYVRNFLIGITKDFSQLILYSVILGITDDSKMR
ncbi:unnamed protein product [Rotaria sp. Silwood1]|nr:unnamed protein product [Rotaria sp. Silwood1]CAF3368945.1 unnamed protein product [Rotaria sp. Silwood1]CAF3452483.1 unnamed protein product [Rotaria sp. Silwood1]CAF3465416.1 unnamed protein product [Rotaria sp. Silwood1]CAF4630460.1 unnamed protein product [Rotaria sp. Silwood1]